MHWRWEAPLVGEVETLERVEDAIEWAGNRALEEEIALAGGDPERTLWFVKSRRYAPAGDSSSLPARSILGYLTAMLGMVSYFLLTMGTVSEREEGVSETLAATAAPAWIPLVVRLAVATGLELVGGWLVVGSVLAVLPHAALTLPRALGYTLQVGCALALLNCVYLLVGLLAPTAKAAYNLGSLPLALSFGLLALAVTQTPPWIPLVGVLSAETAGDIAVGAAATLATAALAVAATARWVGWEGAATARGTGE